MPAPYADPSNLEASWPTVIAEVGLTSNNPTQLSTSLVLGDATHGKLDVGTLGISPTWSSITQDIVSFTIARPMTRLQGPIWNYQAGTCSIVLDNSDGKYDPDNAGSPFAGNLLPMVPIRFRVDVGSLEYKLWFGYADGWQPAQVTYEGEYAELTLNGTDAVKILTGLTLAALGSPTGVGADTGARVLDILQRSGWYTSAEWKAIDTGNSLLQGTSLGDTAWNLMQLAVDSELGQLYIRGDGAVVFRARRSFLTDARSNTVQAVFGDSPGTVHTAGTELRYSRIGRANDDTTLINDVQATRAGGTMQEAQDAPSIQQFSFPRTYPRSDLILQTDSDALNWAQFVVAIGRNAEDRFDSITINPMSDPANLWPQVLSREIGDRIQIWSRPAAATAPITKDCFITGITHTVDAVNLTWQTTWTLQDASKYGSFMVLDNSTLGRLGLNALAF
jgi:hypothetical protein